MSSETARTLSRKQVLPDVWVPVINTITFKDSVNRGQETQYTYDNSPANTTRVVSVVAVGDDPTSPPDPTNSSAFLVERVRSLITKDSVNRGQEELLSIGGLTDDNGAPIHWIVQYVRYCENNDPSASSYVDVQQIVEFHDKDAVNRGQERQFVLTNWPAANSPIDDGDVFKPTFAECDMSLPIADYSDTMIDPPWRLDPWQDIVLVSQGGIPSFGGFKGGGAGTPLMQITSDGAKSWSPWIGSDALESPVFSVASGGGAFVAATSFFGRIYSSKDGRAWTKTLDAGFGGGSRAVYCKPSKATKSRWYLNSTDSDGNQLMYVSDNGFKWAAANNLVDSGLLPSPTGIDFANGSLYASAQWEETDGIGYQFFNSALFRSDDGESWTKVNVPDSSLTYADVNGVHHATWSIGGVAYSNGLYVMNAAADMDNFGLNRNLMVSFTSTDGKNFSGPTLMQIAQGREFPVKAPIVCGKLFIVGGGWYEFQPPPSQRSGTASTFPNIGKIGASLDGRSWTYYQPIPQQGSDLSQSNAVDFGALVKVNSSTFAAIAMDADASNNFFFNVRPFLATIGKNNAVSFEEVAYTANLSGTENFVLFADPQSIKPK